MRPRPRAVFVDAALAVVMAAVALTSLPSQAQEAVVPVDTCTGVDHFPSQPVGGAPSKAVLAAALPLEHAGDTLTVSIDGASGPQQGTGIVGPDGVVVVELPLDQYGAHRVTAATLSGSGLSVDPTAFGDGGTFTVDASEPACDPAGLSTATTTTTETPTTTTTQAPTTTEAPVPTTAAPSTTVASTTVPTTAATPDEAGGFAGWLLVAGGVGLALLGGYLLKARSCDPLLRAWQAAQRRYEQAREALEEANAYHDERRARRAEIEAELEATQRSADTGSITEHGVTYQVLPDGGKVTAEGMQSILDGLRRQLKSARDAEADAAGDLERWRQTTEETVAQAEAARSAYEACVGAASAPPSTTSGTGSGGGGTVTAPGGASTAEGPEQEGCPEGDRRSVALAAPESIRLCRAYRIEVLVEGETLMGGAGEQMALDLKEVAAGLGVLGALLGARGAGANVATGTTAAAGGSWVVGGAGIVRGGVEGLLAAKGNLGTTDFPVPVPTSGPEVVVGGLQLVAQLAALVADKASEWTERRQFKSFVLVREYQTVTVQPFEVHVCDGGAYRCDQRVLEYTFGPVQTLRTNPTDAGTGVSELDRARQAAALRRLLAVGKSSVDSSLRKLLEVEAKYPPGPCGG